MSMMTIAGGRITCLRCHAKSKRTGLQCRAPAMSGKAVCRTHGGLSTGPTTALGRARCAVAKTVHGRETRELRQRLAEGMRELAQLKRLAIALGLISRSRKL